LTPSDKNMSQKRSIIHYVVAYLLWIVSTGLGILVLNMGREAILLGIVVSTAQSDATQSEKFYASLRATAVTSWSILVVGLLVLILLVGIENFYRISVPSGKMIQRFFLVSGIELIVLFIAHAGYYVLLQSFRPATWMSYALLAVEILGAGVCIWLFRTLRKKGNVVVQ
jgi:hypothetical protein